jgi:uncharacterized protein (TIGR00255 family)
MPLYSMTGFGRGESSDSQYNVTVELKSVNHRFKDTRFKMSSLFNSLEIELKKELFSHFKRGSFDIFINFKRAEKNSKFDDIDFEKVKSFLALSSSVIPQESLKISPTDFLRNEFMMENDLSKDETLLDLTRSAFKKACESLKSSRLSEGQKLDKVINDHLGIYKGHFSSVESQTPAFQKNVEEKLKKRFEEMKTEINIDEPRFMQEVVFYLEKLDVHEEINRIKAHLEKLDEILGGQAEVGRQIDFLVQELNRETNTIGSKSSMQEISDNVVQMKVQLEKIREQGLNLE